MRLGVGPGVKLGARLGVDVHTFTQLTLARSMCQYRSQDVIHMIHLATVTMVTMAITLLQHVIQPIHTAVVTMVITKLRGVIQPIHTAVVTRRPTIH